MMDGRRHSVDIPISRTLVALRRVRSLRDPSTNSMSKLSSLVDNLNWETKSSSSIILGFDNGYSNDNNVSSLRSSRLFMANEQPLCEHELNYSLRNCESRRASCEYVGGLVRNAGLDAGIVKQEMACEREKSRTKCEENEDDSLQIESIRSLSDFIDSGDSCTRPKTRLKKGDKRCCSKSKCSSWNRKHNRLSRVRAGNVLSPDVSPCMSASDASREGLSSGTPCYGSADVDLMKQGDRRSMVRNFWSRTTTETNLQTDLEEWPLMLTDADQVLFTEESIDGQQNREGIASCLGTPRSLCQKYMPKSFEELVGQNLVAESLLSAISNGRIASLYLFHGPRGTGKTSTARVFAAALNCLSPDIEKPCGLCQDCVLFFSGRNNDVKEVDAVEINKISRFRSLIKDVGDPPIFSSFKVYIVDECHLLRGETWAALLDKLEELPPHSVFIMVTSELDKLPSSAVSKTQRYNFQMVKVADIASKLRVICQEEGVDIDEDALNFIATKSNGSVREAETMLDQLSLLGKKITMSLVYEANGVVSEAELLDLLYLALSSDASNTIKKARELIESRIDPLQLISQLAGLIMNILAGKCEGVSDMRRKLFGLHKSEAESEQLRHALKILSEAEKQLRLSKNQTTWLTVALLQLSSGGASHEEDALRLSPNILHSQDGVSHRMSANECCKQPVTSSCENVIQDEVETLELIWERATRICESSSVKNFLKKRGKLVSIRLIQGVAVADLEFDHPDHVSRAEKSWKVVAGVLQSILGYNVELRINLADNASKLKKPSLNLFSCSKRVHLGSHFCAECGSSASEYSGYTPTVRDRHVQTCSSHCGSQILHTCSHGNEMVSSIRNSDGNALSIGIRTPHKSLPDNMDRDNSLSNGITNETTNSMHTKSENRSRRREYWKIYCWRTMTFPFRKAQSMLEKKLH